MINSKFRYLKSATTVTPTLCVILKKPNEIEKMKIYLQLILLSILFLAFGCKEKITEQNTNRTEKQVEQKKSIEPPKDSVAKKKKKELPKHYEHKYVISRSGLNYRDLPNGNILGKFPLNLQLKIIEYTKIADQIKDGEKTIKGEWVGVEKNSDTVYVFNGFLSYSYVQSDIKLYYASSSYKENDGKTRTAFLNLSETYFYNKNGNRNKTSILTESDLTKDTIRLNQNQKKKLITELKISESDKVFIYLMKNDSILSFNIKDLPAIACLNIYDSGNYGNLEDAYEFGFDLGEKIKDSDNFVYIGKANPFQTGKLESIAWKKIKNQEFPKKFSSNIIDDRRRWWFNGIETGQSYKFSTNNLDYYIQNLNKDEKLEHRYMIVIDSKTKKIIYENVQIDSESTYLIPLKTENSKELYYSQWTGELFKNKPVVMFGFLGFNFGCPSITVLDETEPTIPILCDNRH